MNPWIATRKMLPELGERVEVKGAHTPRGTGFPIAYRREDRTIRHARNVPFPPSQAEEKEVPWRWESTQWRGTVGITHWRKISGR